MSENNTEQLDEFKDAAGTNVVAEPVAKGSTKRPADKSNGEPMPKLDVNDEYASKLSKSEVITYVTNYVAGLDVGTAVEFYNKLKAEYASKDATNGGGHGTAKGDSNKGSIVAREDLELVLATDESLTEEFKTKLTTIFEAAVAAAIIAETARLEEETEAKLDEAVEAVTAELTEKVEANFTHVVEAWKEENKVALEASLRVEATESFMEALKTVFAEHYVNIPADKVDVVEALSSEVEELEARVNEEVSTAIALRTELAALKAEKILEAKLEGLTDTQKERVRKLAETVEFSDEYETKLSTLVEAVASPKSAQTLTEDGLADPVEEEAKTATIDPTMAVYAQAITRTLKK